jgi:hypothetical protein
MNLTNRQQKELEKMSADQRAAKINQYEAANKIQDAIDDICRKEPAALVESEKSFLRSRRTYLTPQQKEIYKEVISDPVPVEQQKSPMDRLVDKPRKKLDKMAESLNLNPEDYENKEQIAQAIIEVGE